MIIICSLAEGIKKEELKDNAPNIDTKSFLLQIKPIKETLFNTVQPTNFTIRHPLFIRAFPNFTIEDEVLSVYNYAQFCSTDKRIPSHEFGVVRVS